MPLYFTTTGFAFSNPGSAPDVFVQYDSSTQALTLSNATTDILLGDLDSPELTTIVRKTVGDFAVLTQPLEVDSTQDINSKIRVLNTDFDAIVTTGGIQAQTVRTLSDARQKENISALPSMRKVLENFCPKTFQYKSGGEEVYAGILAQDLQNLKETEPFVVKNSSDVLTVDYTSYLICLIYGLREELYTLKKKIQEEKKLIIK